MMNKNIFRKGLSVFATSALVGAALAAVPPAYAAGELKIEPSSGVGFKVPHAVDFELKTSITAGNSNADLQFLKYKITTGGGIEVSAATDDSTTSASASTTVLVDVSEASDVIAAGSADSADAGNFLALFIEEAANDAYEVTDSDASITVTAFVDRNGDDVVDSDEWQVSQVVTWLDNANYDFVNVLTTPVITDTTLEAVVTSATMNLAQSGVVVDFTSSAGITVTSGSDETGTYSATDNDLTFAPTTVSGAIATAGGTYAAQLQNADGSTNIAKSTKTVVSTDVNNILTAVSAGADNEALASGDVDIRSGSGSATVKLTVRDSSNDAIEDEVVTVTLAENAVNSLDSGASVTIGNSSALTNSSATKVQKVTATATSDKDGKVSFAIRYSGVKKTNVLKLTVSVAGGVKNLASTDATTASNDAVTFTAEDAAAASIFNLDTADASASIPVVAEDAVPTVNYSVLDQFGQLFTKTGYQVVVTNSTDSTTHTASVVNGRAAVALPSYDSDNNGSKSLSAQVHDSDGTKGLTAATSTLVVSDEKAVSTLTLAGTYGTSSSKSALNTEDTAASDARLGQSTDAPTSAITNATATVRDANGNTTRSQVTFAGENLIFKLGTGVFTKGSATVWTNASGVAAVEVSSQFTGTQVMTVTSGSASATKSIVFAAAAATTGTTLVVSVPAYVSKGATAQVVATLTDVFGNPVKVTDTNDISITYSGPGIAFPSTLPTTTDANGQAKFAVLVGSNDSGTGTVTVKYDRSSDGDFTGTTTGDLDLTSTASFTVGEAPVDQKVNAGSFKGYVAVYARGYEGQRLSAKIGKDWVIVDPIVNNQEDGTLFRVTDFTGAGVNIAVRIYIDRVLIDTINLTTK